MLNFFLFVYQIPLRSQRPTVPADAVESRPSLVYNFVSHSVRFSNEKKSLENKYQLVRMISIETVGMNKTFDFSSEFIFRLLNRLRVLRTVKTWALIIVLERTIEGRKRFSPETFWVVVGLSKYKYAWYKYSTPRRPNGGWAVIAL